MRTVVQRVSSASLSVVESDMERDVCRIEHGLVCLVGVHEDDTETEAKWTAAKITHLRIFRDDADKMNHSVLQINNGGVLVVPNFTVAGSAQKGRRPDFTSAMKPPEAERLWNLVADSIQEEAAKEGVELLVQRGVFGAHMRVGLVNDGPVTIVLESPSA